MGLSRLVSRIEFDQLFENSKEDEISRLDENRESVFELVHYFILSKHVQAWGDRVKFTSVLYRTEGRKTALRPEERSGTSLIVRKSAGGCPRVKHLLQHVGKKRTAIAVTTALAFDHCAQESIEKFHQKIAKMDHMLVCR